MTECNVTVIQEIQQAFMHIALMFVVCVWIIMWKNWQIGSQVLDSISRFSFLYYVYNNINVYQVNAVIV